MLRQYDGRYDHLFCVPLAESSISIETMAKFCLHVFIMSHGEKKGSKVFSFDYGLCGNFLLYTKSRDLYYLFAYVNPFGPYDSKYNNYLNGNAYKDASDNERMRFVRYFASLLVDNIE